MDLKQLTVHIDKNHNSLTRLISCRYMRYFNRKMFPIKSHAHPLLRVGPFNQIPEVSP